ncbi:hypothetical protein LSCM1_05070 [Leishmania martiniquensis]|uniref:Ribosomal RNA-processing protein 14/surfeit locus protein 6 C-terminal domain-containing protein n=1 Tax=Leishmania martiniquensis TaxID=1580590 RepID=A0A836KLT9_9TRYP|nr:hypothetical protein LSCM1_05070 [Leishmania martiniquensis]
MAAMGNTKRGKASLSLEGHRNGRRKDSGIPDLGGARPFALQQRTGGASARSWSRNRDAKRRSLSVEDRMTQPIRHVVPLDLSFGNFEFQEMKSLGKRGGGVRELSSLLRQVHRTAATHSDMLQTRQGAEMRSEDLLASAMQRLAGVKVKDDPHRIAKALAKRRSKKRQSARRWAKRVKSLEDSVESAVKDRSIQKQSMKARKEAKGRAKVKRREAAGGGGTSLGSGGKKLGAKKQKSVGGKKKR